VVPLADTDPCLQQVQPSGQRDDQKIILWMALPT